MIGAIRSRRASGATLGLALTAASLWLVVLPLQLIVFGVLRVAGTGVD